MELVSAMCDWGVVHCIIILVTDLSSLCEHLAFDCFGEVFLCLDLAS